MTTEEMLAMNDNFIKEIWPLYRELHTWARYELAKKYKQKVPDLFPHTGFPINGLKIGRLLLIQSRTESTSQIRLIKKHRSGLLRKEKSFISPLDLTPLPTSFYEKSSLYPLPPDAQYKKNNHASAWHIDIDQDVRSLMSVETNTAWWETSLHELGHIYYFKSYSTPDVPVLEKWCQSRIS